MQYELMFRKIKSKMKELLPKSIFNIFYKIYKNIFYYFDKTQDKELINFQTPIFKEIKLDNISFEIKIDPDNGSIDKEIYSKGIFEPQILKEIKSIIDKDSFCLDIGANIGQHSLYMSQIAKEGKIFSFEPLKKLAEQIKESLEKNNIQNVKIYNFGLSNKNEILNIHLDNLNIGRSTFTESNDIDSSVEKAEVKIFDEIWNDKDKIDFIKMDVEGYEYYALLGMKRNLEKYHPKIILEFSPMFYKKMNIQSREILNFLFALNYKIYDLENNKKEIINQDQEIHNFLNQSETQTNLLCI